ncbi:MULTISPECIES: leucine-rich repeat domain-containing protein [Wolbachia]|uniref:leucine-rich repeat domain-containing protein n=1 Tax=Wolbachia TaxID=953 RepID=UPI0022300DFD|nr:MULTISPECIES: hypothetical protein [unclassified Wolbachia]
MNFSEYVKNNALVIFGTKVNINELIAFLQSNTHITELSLPHCRIGNEGVEALAEGNLTHLTKLDLSVNNIGDEGVKALTNGNLTHLTKLDLGCNRIGDEGAKALAEGNFTNLTELDLGGNDFGDEGAEALKHNLKSSTSLVLFCVSTVDMRGKLMNAVEDLQKAIDREFGFVQATNSQQRSILRNIEFNILKEIFGGSRNTQATNDQPSSELSEVQQISHGQLLSSLHSDDSDIEVISRSQCR